jgi:hypothetical protein
MPGSYAAPWLRVQKIRHTPDGLQPPSAPASPHPFFAVGAGLLVFTIVSFFGVSRRYWADLQRI